MFKYLDNTTQNLLKSKLNNIIDIKRIYFNKEYILSLKKNSSITFSFQLMTTSSAYLFVDVDGLRSNLNDLNAFLNAIENILGPNQSDDINVYITDKMNPSVLVGPAFRELISLFFDKFTLTHAPINDADHIMLADTTTPSLLVNKPFLYKRRDLNGMSFELIKKLNKKGLDQNTYLIVDFKKDINGFTLDGTRKNRSCLIINADVTNYNT